MIPFVVVSLILLVRVSVLENPYMWQFLPVLNGPAMEKITSTGRGLIWWRFLYTELLNERTDCLGIGSSMVQAMFRHPFEGRCGKLIVRDGMQTMDLFLNHRDIIRFRPGTVILVSSEFMIQQPLHLAGIKHTSGLDFSDMMTLFSRVRKSPEEYNNPLFYFTQSLLSFPFSEYRFQPLFRLYLNSAAGKPPRGRGSVSETPREDADRCAKALESRTLTPGRQARMDNALFFLDLFLEKMTEAGIHVILVEAPLRADLEAVADEAFAAHVRKQFALREARFPGMTFLPRNEFPAFSLDEFHDLTHMNRKGRLRFLQAFNRALSRRGMDLPCSESLRKRLAQLLSGGQ